MKAAPRKSAVSLTVPFKPSAACKKVDAALLHLRFLRLHLTKIYPASRFLICAALP
jgi:hypothetical protein